MKHAIHRRKYLLCALVVVGALLALSFAAKYFAELNTISAATIDTGGNHSSPPWQSYCMESVTESSASTTAVTDARTRVSDCAESFRSACEVQGSPLGVLTVGAQTETSMTYSYHMWPLSLIFNDVMTTIQQEVKCDYLPGYLEEMARNALNSASSGMPVSAPSGTTAPTGVPAMPATNGIIP